MAAVLISCGAFVPLAVTGKWPFHTRRVSRITLKALVLSSIIKSVCLVGNGRLKERCGLESRSNFFRLRNRQKLVRTRFGCGLDTRIYGMYTYIHIYVGNLLVGIIHRTRRTINTSKYIKKNSYCMFHSCGQYQAALSYVHRHVEQFPEIIKVYNVASCWIYIGM